MTPEESPETKFDRLKRQLQESILRDYPNPERKGCPGSDVVREFAARPLDQPVEDDPHWDHITHCSQCYSEFLSFNNAIRETVKRKKPRVAWGVAAATAMLVIGAVIGMNRYAIFPQRPQNAELAWTKKTIIVPSTSRSGNVEEQQPILLDRLPLELTLELPVGSKSGDYEVQIKGTDGMALSTAGKAAIKNGTTAFNVKINLSQFKAGRYSMIIRQVPNDWNLYPVVVR